MAPLTASMQEHLEYRRDMEARAQGVPESDIADSARTGMDTRDIGTFRLFSRESLLFVIRCPKVAARGWHGLLPPKIMTVKEKTGSSGTVVTAKHGIFVSDYDMMSVWKQQGRAWTKIFISAAEGASQGPWLPEARGLVLRLNRKLVSRIQHGCQDDFQSAKNPGVKSSDHFAAFENGQCLPLADPYACSLFYSQRGLSWPYDASGRYTGPTH